MPQFEEYKHKGTIFQVRLPLEWDEFEDYLEFEGIKFLKMVNLIGFFEVFSRSDYEFGGLKDCIFIDVGANTADSTLYAASKEHISSVYAYEPFPEVYKVAKVNLELNPRLAEKVKLYNYGWFDKNKRITTTEVNNINASAVNTIIPELAEIIKHEQCHEVELEIHRSSDVLKEIIKQHSNNPIVLKMDIEGAEYECVKDIDKAGLLKKIDIVFMEWHIKGYKQITDILEKNGFIWFNEKLSGNSGFIRAYRKSV